MPIKEAYLGDAYNNCACGLGVGLDRMASSSMISNTMSRDVPLGRSSAIVVIDMQNAFVHSNGYVWEKVERSKYIDASLESAIRNISTLLAAARTAGVEVIYTVVESLTANGRERSLDYKLSGIHVPRNSWGAQVVEQLTPGDDEIVLPKGSCSVFLSTNLPYLLRNLGIAQVVITGGLTDQCVDSAVRDACDLGFLVTTVTDAVYTHTSARHQSALSNSQGFCRQVVTSQVVNELVSLAALAAPSAAPRVMPGIRVPQRASRCSPGSPRDYLRFEVTDINGKALHKLVPMRHRNSKVYMYSGALAFGSNSEVITVPAAVLAAGCPNAEIVPDWATEQCLPWAGIRGDGTTGDVRVSRVLCEQLSVNGGRDTCPRTVCRRLLKELSQHDGRGLELLSACELEFCIAKSGSYEPLFDGPEIFVTLQNAKSAGFQYAVEAGMDAVGIDVRTLNAEYGPGQLEITFSPKLGIAGPDDAATFRTGVKEIAQLRGLWATFSSKPFALAGSGNGGHFNFSLWEPAVSRNGADGPSPPAEGTLAGMRPVMGGKNGLSETGEHFVAGILAHAAGMEAICAPTPGCYARHGNWAPTAADWGLDDRLSCVRVKLGECGEETYCEVRSPSSAANAYLVVAAVVSAGLDGLQRKLTLPSCRTSKGEYGEKLPASLPEALIALEKDEYLVERIGKEIVSMFVAVKRAELKKLEEWISSDASEGIAEDVARLKAWQKMYFEYL